MTLIRQREVILHRPRGEEHPYEQSAVERFPRRPIAGQRTELGAVTAQDADEVWAEWWTDAGEDRRTEATQVQWDGEGQRAWRMALPPFARGTRVSYRLSARLEGGVFSTETFTFTVAGWSNVSDVVDVQFAGNNVYLTLAHVHAGAPCSLTLSFQDADRLQLQWRLGPPAEAEDDSGGKEADARYTVLEDEAEFIRVQTEALQVTVKKVPFSLTIADAAGSALLQESQPPAWLLDEAKRPLQVRQTFASPDDEAFYGFGERFNTLDQRGQSLDMCVYDQYCDQGSRTYIPVPFFVSSHGYGLYMQTSRYVSYDLARDGAQWSFRAHTGRDGALSYTVIARPQPWQIVSAFTEKTGKPALPPPWVFGPWMSSNDWNSQAMVDEQVRLTQQHEIPATVLVIEAWSDEATFYIWNDARYEPRPGGEAFSYDDFTFPPDGLWPDPKGMIEALHAEGLRLILWQIPVMKYLDEPHAQKDNDEAHMLANEYCVRKADGRPYRVRPFWFHDGLVWDVTNPEGVEWWLQKRAYLLEELGIDGFKTDGGEHIWGRDLRFSDGRRSDELWNLYPNLYVGAYHRFAREKRNGDAVTFSRAGFTGAQAFPCHWAGDETSTWQAFRASIVAGLNAGISGIPFWGWDLAGFSGDIPTAELYLRATAMATFCPVMQYHSDYNARRKPSRDRTPWNIQARTGDEDVIPTFRRFANLRMNLLPYITSEAHYAAESGRPLMRALPLEFPGDRMVRDYPYQYMFGRELLVAPVVEPERERWPVYLPPGEWYDFWSGARFDGNQVIDVAAQWNEAPVFVRAGSVLPLNLNATRELASPVGNDVDRYEKLCFWLFAGDASTYRWWDHVSETVYEFEMQKSGAKLRVTVPALPYAMTLVVPGHAAGRVTVDGAILKGGGAQSGQATADEGWRYDEDRGDLLVRLNPGLASRTLTVLDGDG